MPADYAAQIRPTRCTADRVGSLIGIDAAFGTGLLDTLEQTVYVSSALRRRVSRWNPWPLQLGDIESRALLTPK
jgi:hypothetical protein